MALQIISQFAVDCRHRCPRTVEENSVREAAPIFDKSNS
jgi:hypothetical protein